MPILEPFEEALRFDRAAAAMPPAAELMPSEQPALDELEHYEPERLQEVVEDAGGEIGHRRLAAAILVRRSLEDGDAAPAIDGFFNKAIAAEKSDEVKRWLARTACLAEPDPADEEARASLPEVLKDQRADSDWWWRVQAAAARALGRRAMGEEAADLLTTLATGGSSLKLRADAGVALAKAGVETARPALEALVDLLGRSELAPGDDREALVAACHGLRLLGQPGEAILGRVKSEGDVLQFLARRGIQIQTTPLNHEKSAKPYQDGEPWDQLVRLTPGREPFPGHFVMGAEEPEGVFFPPQRKVAMAGPFGMGRFPVTNEEWRGFRLTFDLPEASFLGRTNIREEDVPRWPALDVSWSDANLYCAWLSRITGERWRLPRESEWEYACRAGTPTIYAWGDEEPHGAVANFAGAFGQDASSNPIRRPVNVEGHGKEREASFCNAFGLWQMHGNVAEWCQDSWNESLDDRPDSSGEIAALGNNSQAVLRGGSWIDGPQHLRSAFRYATRRYDRNYVIGFRVARTHVE